MRQASRFGCAFKNISFLIVFVAAHLHKEAFPFVYYYLYTKLVRSFVHTIICSMCSWRAMMFFFPYTQPIQTRIQTSLCDITYLWLFGCVLFVQPFQPSGKEWNVNRKSAVIHSNEANTNARRSRHVKQKLCTIWSSWQLSVQWNDVNTIND